MRREKDRCGLQERRCAASEGRLVGLTLIG
jgi:hypothetical protein